MSEAPVVFGGETALSGILTVPAAAAEATGVVFLSAGVRHRVGPNRMHVRLARAVAAAGLPALRFDLSGIGESGSRPAGSSYEETVLEDTRAAMDVLAARHGVRRFVLYGLCSGADNAFRVAIADTRVAGVAMLQPFSFGSRGYAVERSVRALLDPANWARLAAGRMRGSDVAARLRGILRRRPGGSEAGEAAASPWRMPPAESIVAGLRALAGRGARLLLVYSPPSPSEYNYRSILRAEARRLGERAVRVEAFMGSDHNITPLHHQARFVALVAGWALEVARDAAGG